MSDLVITQKASATFGQNIFSCRVNGLTWPEAEVGPSSLGGASGAAAAFLSVRRNKDLCAAGSFARDVPCDARVSLRTLRR